MATLEPADGYSTKQLALHLQILRECEEMSQFAFGMGRAVPGRAVEAVETALIARATAEEAGGVYRPDAAEVRKLAASHEELSRLVAPARPNCLVLMDEEARTGGMLYFLGPVGLVRRLMLVSILFLASFIILAMFDGVGPDFDPTSPVRAAGAAADSTAAAAAAAAARVVSSSVLSGSGLLLLGNMLFYIASAGLGASFGLLFEVNGYIVDRTFDPKYESSYWIKMVLGMIAGFILVTLVPLETGAGSFARPTIAMLGGFSASAVYRILNRMVQTVESMVRGDAKEMLSARETAARARAEEQSAQTRMKMAAGLLQLQQQLGGGASPDDVKRRLDEILTSVMPTFAFNTDDGAPIPTGGGGGSGNGTNGAPPSGSGGGSANGTNGASSNRASTGSGAADAATVLMGSDIPIVAGPDAEAPAPVESLATVGASGESGGESTPPAAEDESGGAAPTGEVDENGAAG